MLWQKYGIGWWVGRGGGQFSGQYAFLVIETIRVQIPQNCSVFFCKWRFKSTKINQRKTPGCVPLNFFWIDCFSKPQKHILPQSHTQQSYDIEYLKMSKRQSCNLTMNVLILIWWKTTKMSLIQQYEKVERNLNASVIECGLVRSRGADPISTFSA